jgi:hypothetical protein
MMMRLHVSTGAGGVGCGGVAGLVEDVGGPAIVRPGTSTGLASGLVVMMGRVYGHVSYDERLCKRVVNGLK